MPSLIGMHSFDSPTHVYSNRWTVTDLLQVTEAILEDARGSLDQVRRLLLTLSSMDQFVQGDNQVLKFGKGGRGVVMCKWVVM